MEDLFFWIFVGFILFGCFMYFQIRKDDAWLVNGFSIKEGISLIEIFLIHFNSRLLGRSLWIGYCVSTQSFEHLRVYIGSGTPKQI